MWRYDSAESRIISSHFVIASFSPEQLQLVRTLYMNSDVCLTGIFEICLEKMLDLFKKRFLLCAFLFSTFLSMAYG